jgi:transcriptional regulator with XRE-family HTH domain
MQNALRQAREAAGLTQVALALRANVPQATISRIERGNVSPTWRVTQGISEALGVDPKALFGDHSNSGQAA